MIIKQATQQTLHPPRPLIGSWKLAKCPQCNDIIKINQGDLSTFKQCICNHTFQLDQNIFTLNRMIDFYGQSSNI
jgi:hypothetical protein